MVTLLVHIDVKEADTVEEAIARLDDFLDDFRNAVIPAQDYGLVIYNPQQLVSPSKLRPTGDAFRDTLVSERLNLRRE